MSQNTFIKSEAMSFASLFSYRKLEVPWHQRGYDWKKEHVIDLLQDIDHAMESKQDFYFLGSLLLINRGNKVLGINDGQQRITTYSLICARFLKLFHDNGKYELEDEAMRILFLYAKGETKKFTDAEDLTPRFFPSRDDRLRFTLLIKGQNISANGKLTQAWNEIDKFVSALSLEKARKYFKYLIEKIEISCLTIPPRADPNMIFESLNFRGKPLEDFDLLRNYLYSFFNISSEVKRHDAVKEKLDENLHHQLVVGNSDKTIEYAHCFLQCKYGFLPKKRFYRKVRENIAYSISRSKERAPDYVFKLIEEFTREDYAELFIIIARQDTGYHFISEFNKHLPKTNKKRNLKVLLDELRSYTVTQPIVFALLSRYLLSREMNADYKKMAIEVYRNIKNINALIMRAALVERKFNPSRFEGELSDLARQIMRIDSIESLLKIDVLGRLISLTSSNVTDDTKFIEVMKTIEIQSLDKAKRFLFAVNQNFQKDFDIIPFAKVTLEHIFPRNDQHQQKWKKFLSEDNPNEYVHRIGNLTLFSINDNVPVKRDSLNWQKKKHALKSSILAINSGFTEIGEWGPQEIEKRQRNLAKAAARIWSFRV